MTDHYDVVVIGSGAGGATLTHRLAPSGKRVLLLERGGWSPRESSSGDATEVLVGDRYASPDTWYDSDLTAFQPHVHYAVGGATKVYGAALDRLRQKDFRELRHHGGVSPAWPVTYDELEPYYDQAEDLYQVHGTRGEDPTEPRSRRPYPFPPVLPEPRIQELSRDLTALGLHPYHAPCGIVVDESSAASSACVRAAACDRSASLLHARADAEVIAVRPALRHPNVTLVTNAQVRRLGTDDSGRTVTSVVAEVDGVDQRFSGDVVVVSAGAVNSAKLLLASANDRHPRGLANGSDQVGRRVMFQNRRTYMATSRERPDTRFETTLGINDFYFGDETFRFPMGNVQLGGTSSLPVDGAAEHAVGFWLCTEDLPDPANRVTLGIRGNVVLAYTPNNRRPLDELYRRLQGVLGNLGVPGHALVRRDSSRSADTAVADFAHQAGTVRFGDDPATSVLDRDCRAHEVDNLYVVDTSFFPSIGAVNPALTAMANALRVGDHLLDRLG